MDYYTEIHLTLPGEHKIYSDAYNDVLDDAVKALEPKTEFLSKQRFSAMKREAEQEYSDGLREYEDGLEELADAKEEFQQELADGYQKLVDGQQEIIDNRKKLGEAEVQLYNTGVDLQKKLAQVASGLEQLEANRPSEAQRESLNQAKEALEGATGKSLSELSGLIAQGEALQTQIAALETELADPATPEERKAVINAMPVSYTHLTLPTKA